MCNPRLVENMSKMERWEIQNISAPQLITFLITDNFLSSQTSSFAQQDFQK